MKSNTTPRPFLVLGAVYWADNGRRICARCAGASARYTGRDISGQKVARITVEDVRAWPQDLGVLHCEANCTALSPISGPDGWPIVKAAVCPCGCEGRIADHDDRGWSPWSCPVCGDDSDADLGKPCTNCDDECPECARSYGPHYRGRCEHGSGAGGAQ
jgi:hypothetical protein